MVAEGRYGVHNNLAEGVSSVELELEVRLRKTALVVDAEDKVREMTLK